MTCPVTTGINPFAPASSSYRPRFECPTSDTLELRPSDLAEDPRSLLGRTLRVWDRPYSDIPFDTNLHSPHSQRDPWPSGSLLEGLGGRRPPSLPPLDVLPPNVPRNRWPDNTWVVGSCRQEEEASFDAHPRQVARLMRQGMSLPQALQESARVGVDGTNPLERPVLMDRATPGSWDPNRPNVPRIVLLVSGDGGPERDGFRRECDELQEAIQRQYPNARILRLPHPATREQVEAAMREMQQFARDNPGAEALTYFSAHGRENGLDAGVPRRDRGRQGASNGELLLRGGWLNEDDIKNMTRQYLGGFRSNIMWFGTCHSGSFVASLPPTQPPGTAVA